MRHYFSFDVNNQGTLTLYQNEHNGAVELVGGSDGKRWIISAGEMVMLLNWYRYVKRYDIQDDFINPGERNAAETVDNWVEPNV